MSGRRRRRRWSGNGSGGRWLLIVLLLFATAGGLVQGVGPEEVARAGRDLADRAVRERAPAWLVPALPETAAALWEGARSLMERRRDLLGSAQTWFFQWEPLQKMGLVPTAEPAVVSLQWQWPAEGAILREFGWDDAAGRLHPGLDILARAGDPVRAVAVGQVLRIYRDPDLGQVVEVAHGSLIGLYARVDQPAVTADSLVRRGELIGVIARGSGTEPAHLHFEVLTAGRVEVDPAAYLPGGRRL